MNDASGDVPSDPAADACLAASMLAVDPHGLGGVCLRSHYFPTRARWLDLLRNLSTPDMPMPRIPCTIPDSRLFGGLDVAATLEANRPVIERGVLAAADGGVVLVAMAERLSAHTAACLCSALDAGGTCADMRIGIVALDESVAEGEGVSVALVDRLALLVDLDAVDPRALLQPLHTAQQTEWARRALPEVAAETEFIEAICGTGLALGAGSLRVSMLAVRSARVLAALDGRLQVSGEDAVAAARLVFAPRATRLPMPEGEPDAPAAPPAPPPSGADGQNSPPDLPEAAGRQRDPQGTPTDTPPPTTPTEDVVLAAARAAIPRGLLDSLLAFPDARQRPAAPGRAGAHARGGSRGRPAGVRNGAPRGQGRLDVIETLRAAAPWQRLRGRVSAADGRIRIAPADLRIVRYRQPTTTLTIFAVDASGSSALHRLAEAKGAVELLLADCYVRRDRVAVIAFRGRSAELLLPPTRSLVRAKRNLAGLPGGGGTPLAAALESALLVALQAKRRGESPLLVLLSDGRANVSKDGSGGREAAHAQALQGALRLRLAHLSVLFVDTSPRSNPQARELAVAMGARYVPLPHAESRALSGVVAAATTRADGPRRREG